MKQDLYEIALVGGGGGMGVGALFASIFNFLSDGAAALLLGIGVLLALLGLLIAVHRHSTTWSRARSANPTSKLR